MIMEVKRERVRLEDKRKWILGLHCHDDIMNAGQCYDTVIMMMSCLDCDNKRRITL